MIKPGSNQPKVDASSSPTKLYLRKQAFHHSLLSLWLMTSNDCSELILQEWLLALQLILDVGKQRVLKPTLVTQNTLMGALAGAGRWQMALRALRIVDPDAWPGFCDFEAQ